MWKCSWLNQGEGTREDRDAHRHSQADVSARATRANWASVTGSPDGLLAVNIKGVRRFKVRRDVKTLKLSKVSSMSCHGTVIKKIDWRLFGMSSDVLSVTNTYTGTWERLKNTLGQIVSQLMAYEGSFVCYSYLSLGLRACILLFFSKVLSVRVFGISRTCPLCSVMCASWSSRWLTGEVSTAPPSSASFSGSPSRTCQSSWWATRATLSVPVKSVQTVCWTFINVYKHLP